LKELDFTITADLVRQLKGRSARMIGNKLTYAENDIESDTMVIFFHGMGADHRTFADILPKHPCRGIAPTLYGFEAGLAFRPALSLQDHSILLRAIF